VPRAEPASDDFSRTYDRLLEAVTDEAREEATGYRGASQNVREEIVRCIWFGTHFRPEELATDDGRRIEVLSPGWWNVEGGPDFLNAEVLLEGEGRLSGDVEIHTCPSGWRAHGHHRQPEYDGVMLHVVMWEDDSRDSVRDHADREIPQLTLQHYVEEDIGELVEVVDLEGDSGNGEAGQVPGRWCGQAYEDGRLSGRWLGDLLDAAGDHRVMDRARAVEELLEERSPEEVLYRRLAEALGYKKNRMPFLQLINLLPLRQLRRAVPEELDEDAKLAALEGAYFDVSGLLERCPDRAGTDDETADYLHRLERAGRGPAAELAGQRMSPDHWDFSGTRPVNLPGRRLAALACLYARFLHDGLFGHLVRIVHGTTAEGRRRLDTTMRDRLTGVFTGLEHYYWSRRCTLGGSKLDSPLALVGGQRATGILVDVLLPVLLAHARTEGDEKLSSRLHLLWRRLPTRSGNSVTRRMSGVLFGDTDEAGDVIDSARRQQGLHQLYRDFCGSDDGCDRCVVYRAHRQELHPSEV